MMSKRGSKRSASLDNSSPAKRSRHPSRWSVNEVAEFLRTAENASFKTHAHVFKSNGIDGTALKEITSEQLSLMNMPSSEHGKFTKVVTALFAAADDNDPPPKMTRAASIQEDLAAMTIEASKLFPENVSKKKKRGDSTTFSLAVAAFVDALCAVVLLGSIALIGSIYKWCEGEFGWCEHDWFKMWVSTLALAKDATVKDFVFLATGDIAESVVLTGALVLLTALLGFMLLLFSRAQTPGLYCESICVSKNGFRVGVLTMLAWAAMRLVTAPFDLIFGVVGVEGPIADHLLGTKVCISLGVDHAEAPDVRAASDGNNGHIALAIRKEQPWRDLFGLGFFLACQAIIIFGVKHHLGANSTSEDWSFLADAHPFFMLWGQVAATLEHKTQAVAVCLTITYVYFGVFYMLCRAFLKTMFFVSIIAFYVLTIGAIYMHYQYDSDVYHTLTEATSILLFTLYLRISWNRWMLIIEVMKVSFEGALAHPLSIMHVPIIEGIFQLYQLKILRMMAQLFFTFNDEQKLSNGLIFLQLYTVFSMRAMLEIAVARAMSLWYFSVDGESSTERSIGAIVGAHTKSFGTACCAGLVQFIVNQVVGFYRKIKKRYDSLKWSVHNLLPKLALFFLVWMVGWIAVRLEVFAGYTVIFAGIYGTGYVESAKKSMSLMRSKNGLAIEAALSANTLQYCLATYALTILAPILCFAVPVVLDHFGGTPTPCPFWFCSWVSDQFFVGFICVYFFFSATWTLNVAMRTILVCAVDEAEKVPKSKWAAPIPLANAMAKALAP